MLSYLKEAPEGLCPYCSKLIRATLFKEQWFRRNQYLCTHKECKKIVYICLSTSCDNYVKSEKNSSNYCDICCSGYSVGSGGGDGDSYSPSEQREHIGSRHNTFTDSGGDAGDGDGGGGD